jgi:hypothetical protein
MAVNPCAPLDCMIGSACCSIPTTWPNARVHPYNKIFQKQKSNYTTRSTMDGSFWEEKWYTILVPIWPIIQEVRIFSKMSWAKMQRATQTVTRDTGLLLFYGLWRTFGTENLNFRCFPLPTIRGPTVQLGK